MVYMYNVSHISIHSLREEGDVIVIIPINYLIYFNPLPPRGGRQQNCTMTNSRLAAIHTVLTRQFDFKAQKLPQKPLNL